MHPIYLDNNATTRPADEVVEAMLPFLREYYGNPSSVHRFGQYARKAIDEARGAISQLIGCSETELLFTGGGTESVNTAVRGLLATRSPRKRVIMSSVEHSANRQLGEQLTREGFEVIRISVNRDGILNLDQLRAELSESVSLVSTLWANNETGVLFPMQTVGELCRAAGVPLHVDATQAVGKLPINVRTIPIDAMTFAAHKIHGPKGTAALFVRRGVRIRPLIIGGPQERDRRGGTENVPGIVGFGKAAQLAAVEFPALARVAEMRDRFERNVLSTIEQTSINGGNSPRIPNTTNISFARLEAEAILLLLSERNICASAGAACSSGSLEPSPVLLAMGVPPELAHGAIRFSLSRYTTEQEIEQTLQILPQVIARLRQVLPVGAHAR